MLISKLVITLPTIILGFSICSLYGCSSFQQQVPYIAKKRNPITIDALEQDVRIARERENHFDQVYKNPGAYSSDERNLAVWNLPPFPVPKTCMAEGSESNLDCLRYAARLHALPFFISSSVTVSGQEYLGSFSAYPMPSSSPDGY